MILFLLNVNVTVLPCILSGLIVNSRYFRTYRSSCSKQLPTVFKQAVVNNYKSPTSTTYDTDIWHQL